MIVCPLVCLLKKEIENHGLLIEIYDLFYLNFEAISSVFSHPRQEGRCLPETLKADCPRLRTALKHPNDGLFNILFGMYKYFC